MNRKLRLPKPKKRKTLFSGLRREWTRNPASQVMKSEKDYDRKREKKTLRAAKGELKRTSKDAP